MLSKTYPALDYTHVHQTDSYIAATYKFSWIFALAYTTDNINLSTHAQRWLQVCVQWVEPVPNQKFWNEYPATNL